MKCDRVLGHNLVFRVPSYYGIKSGDAIIVGGGYDGGVLGNSGKLWVKEENDWTGGDAV